MKTRVASTLAAEPPARPAQAAGATEVDALWFHAAVERWRDTVFRVAFNYLRSAADADDVCQDVFVALWRANRAFADDEHLKAWLIRVAINRCKNELRRPWRRVADIDDYAAKLSMPEAGREVFDALMRLPERYRLPLYLHYYEGYGSAEIARALGTRDATVRTRLARGRRRLASALGEDGWNG